MDNLKRSADDGCELEELQQIKRQRLEDTLNLGDKREKVINIINREFENEISKRQEEIDLIQQRLLKAQKTLHLLKYVIVKSFYDNKELNIVREESTVNNKTSLYDLNHSQNRIHPAVKKLLGKKPIENLCFDFARTRGKSHTITSVKEEPKENNSVETSIKEEIIDEVNIKKEVKNEIQETNVPVRHRQKISHEIVIGNISKYVASNNSQDKSTHKWMMYVRGPRHNPDISHIVKKVRFFLHPSYQPNDIIEIDKHPFHLSRRGWGEFPLRIQIHFQNSLNKPVDIIHNLKLDQNRTGRQTLGNETVINVWLYEDLVKDNTESTCSKENIYTKEKMKQENDFAKPGCSKYDLYVGEDTEENENEDDITEDLDEKTDEEIIFETHKNIANLYFNKNNSKMKDETPRDYDLIYLVDHCYTNIIVDNKVLNMYNAEERIDREKYKISIPVSHFTTSRQIIYFLFKSLPLITPLAKDISYKCSYPYVSSSSEEFLSWNYPKRCCAEWYRAKHIKRLLQEYKIAEEEEWTIKFIIMFGRAHAFTPGANYSIFQNKNESGKTIPNNETDSEIISTLTEYIPIVTLMENMHLVKSKKEEENVDVDVENLTDYTEGKKYIPPENSTELDPNLFPLCNYVKKCAAQLHINLEDEEIESGLFCNLTERIILQSVMCLAEELIRTAWANKVVDRQGRNLNCEIERNDILNVLIERDEFDIFTNKGLGKAVT